MTFNSAGWCPVRDQVHMSGEALMHLFIGQLHLKTHAWPTSKKQCH